MHVLPSGPGAGPGRYELPFLNSHAETPTATTFRFSIKGTGFQYRSNQAIRLEIPGARDPRPGRMFSLSSSPTEKDQIAVTVKMTGSGYKEALGSLAPGDPVQVFGPLGDLFYNPQRPAVFVAGGIGVTPFRGMLRFASDTNAAQPIILLYSARNPEEFAFKAELDEIARKHPMFKIWYTVTRPSDAKGGWKGRVGRIDEAWIREALQGLDRPKVYVAGLPLMAHETITMLKERMGFIEDDLEYEFFMGY